MDPACGIQITRSIADIRRYSQLLGYDESDLFSELRDLVAARVIVLLRAGSFTSHDQVVQYLRVILDRTPDELEVALSRIARRRIRISEPERLELELRQNDRCAICGAFLDQGASPHVDHVVPLSKGGADSLENFQLLCSKCNLGKHDLLAWHLGVPYQSEERDNRRLRYVVLARSGGRCAESMCEQTAKTSQLELVTRVPLSLGGRWLFDNLRVACAQHASRINKERESRTKQALTRERRGKRKILS